jgi:hypothetical protein
MRVRARRKRRRRLIGLGVDVVITKTPAASCVARGRVGRLQAGRRLLYYTHILDGSGHTLTMWHLQTTMTSRVSVSQPESAAITGRPYDWRRRLSKRQWMYGFLPREEDGVTEKRWRIAPRSTPGKWSIGLIVAMPLLFAIGMSFSNSIYESVPAGGTILRDIVVRPALALTMLAGMAAGVSAFITGLLSILRKKDHALLVYVSSAIGALLMLFLIAEVAFSH